MHAIVHGKRPKFLSRNIFQVTDGAGTRKPSRGPNIRIFECILQTFLLIQTRKQEKNNVARVTRSLENNSDHHLIKTE